jgi:hypothetical protein
VETVLPDGNYEANWELREDSVVVRNGKYSRGSVDPDADERPLSSPIHVRVKLKLKVKGHLARVTLAVPEN